MKNFALSLFLAAGLACGASVELTWDRHPDLDVTGYIAYWGLTTTYTDSMDVGLVERALIDNLPSGTYRFAVRAYDRSRNLGALSTPITFVVTGGTGAEKNGSLISWDPVSVSPNPFSKRVNIGVTGTGLVSISIYNPQGRLVNKLAGANGRDRCVLAWDGTDAHHAILPQGLYLLRVSVGKDAYARKIFLSR